MKGLASAVEDGNEPSILPERPSLVSMLTAAADVILVMDSTGVIRDVTLGVTDQPLEESRSWLGLGWIDTVAPESRSSIVQLLEDAAADGISARRLVSHRSESGSDIPVSYVALRLLGAENRLLAVGRDLRAESVIQARLIEAQQVLERDHCRMRQIETRYRLLFQVSAEALFIVDGATLKVVEVNPAAAQLFAQPAKKLVGRSLPAILGPAGAATAADQLHAMRSHGRADDMVVDVAQTGQRATLSVSLLRQETDTLFLIRVNAVSEQGHRSRFNPTATAGALDLIESLPDGFVVADAQGLVMTANRAFLDMIEMSTLEQVRGKSLSHWLGRPGADLGLLLATLREHAVVRLFGTSLRGDLGSSTEVEVSCASECHPATGRVGLLIRGVGRRLASGPRGARDITLAVEQLAGLVGQVSLKNLVRDTTDLIERHFIEAALERTADNRTSAAEVLGLSRQSLYVKLRRYNIGMESTEESSGRSQKPMVRKKNRKR